MYISKCIVRIWGETSTTYVFEKSFFIPLSLFETALVKNIKLIHDLQLCGFILYHLKLLAKKKAIQYYAPDLVPHDLVEIIFLDKD